MLPAELLFDGKALPLNDAQARQGVASSLFRSCATVFGFLLGSGDRQSLRILAAWLRAVRKAQRWLPGCASPLPQLAVHLDALCQAVRFAPVEAAEVAQQLAKWRLGSAKGVAILPLLTSLS